jgi:hypothetical protein
MNYFKHEGLYMRLLEYKLMYYHPELVHGDWHDDLMIPDSLYDCYDNQLSSFGLDIPVGFPDDTEEGRQVMAKLAKSKEEWLG